MQAKTLELTSRALDWAVAKVTNTAVEMFKDARGIHIYEGWYDVRDAREEWSPHINQTQGGRLIDSEFITTTPGRRGSFDNTGTFNAPSGWTAWSIVNEDDEAEGETRLVAAMRCLVHSKCGDYIELPDIFNTGSTSM